MVTKNKIEDAVDWKASIKELESKVEPLKCPHCGKRILDECILMGVVKFICPRCKKDVLILFNALDDIIKLVKDISIYIDNGHRYDIIKTESPQRPQSPSEATSSSYPKGGEQSGQEKED